MPCLEKGSVMHGLTDPAQIAELLTAAQKVCILNLTEEWQDRGYSKVSADLLWATDVTKFPERFDPIVERKLIQDFGSPPICHHRLLPLGMTLKLHLESILA